MTRNYALRIALLWSGSLPVWGQTAPTALPKPVQTIALSAQSALSGTVRLANRRTVLFLADAEGPKVHLVALGADGRTAWETDVVRYQHSVLSKRNFFDYRPNWSGSYEAYLRELMPTVLEPLDVLTDGDEVYTVERLQAAAFKKNSAASPLRENQLVVQRVTADGKVSRATFDAPPVPARGTEAYTLGRYAENGAYVTLVREDSDKGRRKAFFLDRHDLGTQAVRRDPLVLPETPEAEARVYNDWAYLGHRPNQTYLFRRVANRSKQPFGRMPMEYEVAVLNSAGSQVGGFSTTLSLGKGTGPVYSAGLMPCLLEQAHVPHLLTAHHSSDYAFESYSELVDDWNISTGIFGDFYLDYATGDVLVFGEFGPHPLPSVARNTERQGTFLYRFAPDGTLLQRQQNPYSKDVVKAQGQANKGAWENRRLYFLQDPFSKQITLSFAGDGGRANLYFDETLAYKKHDFEAAKERQQAPVTTVLFTASSWVYKPWQGHRNEKTSYLHATAGDAPVYARLEALRQAAGNPFPNHQFYVTPFPDNSALAVERAQLQGGSLRVYRIQP